MGVRKRSLMPSSGCARTRLPSPSDTPWWWTAVRRCSDVHRTHRTDIPLCFGRRICARERAGHTHNGHDVMEKASGDQKAATGLRIRLAFQGGKQS